MNELAAVTTVGKTCAGFVFGAAIVLLAVVLIATRTHPTGGVHSRRHRTGRRRAVASFASAVADGDWDRAERAARHALDHTQSF